MQKVFVGLYFETVVVAAARRREDAVPALRAALEPRHRREASSISLLNHIAIVHWSKARSAYWYRLPSAAEACSIHPDRVAAKLRPLVRSLEPGDHPWNDNTSAGRAP
jgi:hypothetical protein